MDPRQPRKNFNARHPRHPRQNFMDPRYPRHPRQNLTHATHAPTNPRHPRDLANSLINKVKCFRENNIAKFEVIEIFYSG